MDTAPGDLMKDSALAPTTDGLVPPRSKQSRSQLRSTLVYLARHGQTDSNVRRVYAGASLEPLNATGRAEVSTLAAQLGLCGIVEVRTSEVNRARESAELIGRILGIPVRLDTRLNEMRMGPWEGLKESEVAERFPQAYAQWHTVPDRLALDGRETLDELARRVTAAFEEAVERPGPALLMTHVAPIRVGVLRALGQPLRLYKRLRVDNGTCLMVDRGAAEVRRLGENQSVRDELACVDSETSAA